MATQMHVRNEVKGDRKNHEYRLNAYREELVAATRRGERDLCSKCGKVAVGYCFDDFGTEFDFFVADCDECHAQIANPC